MMIDRSLPDLLSGSLPQYSFTALFSHEISAYYYINTFKIRICQTFAAQFFLKTYAYWNEEGKMLKGGQKKSKRANATALGYAANESTLTMNKMNTYEKVLFNAFQYRLYIGCGPQVE